MQSVQRKFGKMLKRQEDEADVGTVLAEFKAMGEMLKQLSESLKTWRDSWEDILKLQYDGAEAYSVLYRPIDEEDSHETQHQPVQTPPRFLSKSLSLGKAYAELKTDLAQEIAMVDTKLMRPVQELITQIKPMKKTVKHREDMKLDYERYYSRAEHARKKETRSVKEEVALNKAESDLAQSQIDYGNADDQIKQTFPPFITAIKSLMPYLLTQQVMLQHTLVAQLYTVLDGYCRQHRMALPAPPDGQIIAVFEQEFTPMRKELENGLRVIANGKVINQPMALPPEKGNSVTGLGIRNKGTGLMSKGTGLVHRRKSDQSALQQGSVDSPSIAASSDYGDEEEEAPPVKPPRPGSMPSIPGNKPRIGSATLSPNPNPPYPNNNGHSPGYPTSPWADQRSQARTPPSRYGTPPESVNGSLQPDYFAGSRRPSTSSMASSIAAKKKPPPPVPQKRIPSMQSQWVTALYDFEGQNHGDLGFREGDRIRVVKKTESQDDWWEGELRGMQGSFPANYVKVVVGGVPL